MFSHTPALPLMKLINSALAVFSLFFCAYANAQLITWNTVGNLGTETSQPSATNDAGVLATSLTLGAGVTPAANGNRFGGSNWFDTGDTNPTTFSESFAGDDYIQFIVTPTAGNSISLTSLSFVWDFSGTGPKSLTARSSIDGFSNDIGGVQNLTASTSALRSITFSGLTNITTAVTIRLYGWGATGTGGTGGFDSNGAVAPNVLLYGSVTAIPEPSTYAALFGALALAGVVVHRRRKHAAKA